MHRFGTFALLLGLALTPCACELQNDQDRYPWPEDKRTNLSLPSDLVSEILESTEWQHPRIGYSRTEMSQAWDNPHRLAVVENLFDNALEIPRLTGRVSSGVYENRNQAGDITNSMFRLLGCSAGRGIDAAKPESWGSTIVKDEVTLNQILDTFEKYARENGVDSPLGDLNKSDWNQLPASLRRLVARSIIACLDALPASDQVFADQFFRDRSDLTPKEWYQLLASPLMSMDGLPALPPKDAFTALDAIDLDYLTYASTIVLSGIHHAVAEYQKTESEKASDLALSFEPIVLHMPFGDVVITDSSETPATQGALVFDIGGDDKYFCDADQTPLASTNGDHPFGFLIELAGNDSYESLAKTGYGFAFMGIAGLFDLQGNDTHTCEGQGSGAALYGACALVDQSGNDTYSSKKIGLTQGAAIVGTGLLLDNAGNDQYSCGYLSQGYGGPLGCGFLADVAGNDNYNVVDEYALHPKDLYGGRALALSQGAAFGRRADFDDGHTLSGGIGGLMDFSGDDRYFSHTWTQGCGYWWALGFLEDLEGDDEYHAVQYSQGAAAHYALGSFVDRKGNDNYNDDRVQQQVIGAARDFSIGVFFEGDGNDNYTFPYTSVGSGNLNGIGVFWDRRGDDNYHLHGDNTKMKQSKKRTIGIGLGIKREGLMHNTRDEMLTLGVFLDTQGNDNYGPTETLNDDYRERTISDGRSWHYRNDIDALRGYAIDADWYPAAQDSSAD